VEDLDLPQRRALVRPFEGDWYTQPKKESETFIEQLRDHRSACGEARRGLPETGVEKSPHGPPA
jgi:hypothetical protein